MFGFFVGIIFLHGICCKRIKIMGKTPLSFISFISIHSISEMILVKLLQFKNFKIINIFLFKIVQKVSLVPWIDFFTLVRKVFDLLFVFSFDHFWIDRNFGLDLLEKRWKTSGLFWFSLKIGKKWIVFFYWKKNLWRSNLGFLRKFT